MIGETYVSPMIYRFVVDSFESAHIRPSTLSILFVGEEVTRGGPRVSHVSRKRRLVPRLTNVSDRLGAYWSETETRFMSANDSRHVIYSGLSGAHAYWLSIYAALPAPYGTLIIYWVKVKSSFPLPEGTIRFLIPFCSGLVLRRYVANAQNSKTSSLQKKIYRFEISRISKLFDLQMNFSHLILYYLYEISKTSLINH